LPPAYRAPDPLSIPRARLAFTQAGASAGGAQSLVTDPG